ncbi:hypothetical protein YC2023_044586 [Brassica napus]
MAISPISPYTLTAKKFYPSRQILTLSVAPESKNKPIVPNSKKPLKDYSDHKKPHHVGDT